MGNSTNAKNAGSLDLVDIESVHIRADLPIEQRVADYLRQIKNPYNYLCHGVVVKISFAGKKTFEECLRNALFAREKI